MGCKLLSIEPHRYFHFLSVLFFSDITCTVDVMHPHLNVVGLTPANKTVKIGYKLQFDCDNKYTLDGAGEIECLETGKWNAPFPTCSGMFIFNKVKYRKETVDHVHLLIL